MTTRSRASEPLEQEDQLLQLIDNIKYINVQRCNKPKLVSALKELDALIGMTKLKDSVSNQVKYLITSDPGETMLHTVLYGPPGTGKTCVGKILCKIWSSIGYLNVKVEPAMSPDSWGVKMLEKLLGMSMTSEITYLAGGIIRDSNRLKVDLKHFRNTVDPAVSDNQNLVDEFNSCIVRLSNVTSSAYSISKLLDSKIGMSQGGTGTGPSVGFGSNTGFQMFKGSNLFPKEDSDDSGDNSEDMFDPESPDTLDEHEEEPDDCQDIVKSGEHDVVPPEVPNDGPEVPDSPVKAFQAGTPLNVLSQLSVSRPINVPQSLVLPSSVPQCSDGPTTSSVLNNDSNESLPFKVVSRKDFVGEYVGQTALKTSKLLTESIGKVLFIDEAYSLVQDDRDWFGKEALTTLNLFMSEHPKDVIVVFAGYKELMQESIFREQPGLQRRCTWCFEIENYTASELTDIFKFQLQEQTIDCSANLEPFFTDYIHKFPGFGGDTQKLIFYAKLERAKDNFDRIVKGESVDNTLTLRHLEAGIKSLSRNQTIQPDDDNPHKRMMYS